MQISVKDFQDILDANPVFAEWMRENGILCATVIQTAPHRHSSGAFSALMKYRLGEEEGFQICLFEKTESIVCLHGMSVPAGIAEQVFKMAIDAPFFSI